MILKQDENGSFYLARKTTSSMHAKCITKRGEKLRLNSKLKCFRDWWLVKYCGYSGGVGSNTSFNVSFPKEFVGKKVRFKLEILEDLK